MTNDHGPSRGEPLGPAVGTVIEPLGSFLHADARLFIDLGIPVQRPAYRGLGQAQFFTEFFEIHGFKALSIFCNAP